MDAHVSAAFCSFVAGEPAYVLLPGMQLSISSPSSSSDMLAAHDRQLKKGQLLEVEGWMTTVKLGMCKASTRADLLRWLDDGGLAGLYDFVYLPINYKTRRNIGYAVVNFVDATSTRPPSRVSIARAVPSWSGSTAAVRWCGRPMTMPSPFVFKVDVGAFCSLARLGLAAAAIKAPVVSVHGMLSKCGTSTRRPTRVRPVDRPSHVVLVATGGVH